ncbi:pectin lyase fold/virulence factor [Hyaloraphidium curvatum]|nr:pectin lyase fold/virulence factor [Hyaloraphidium curvatum]
MASRRRIAIAAALLALGFAAHASAQAPPLLAGNLVSGNILPYDVGTPVLREIYVSPTGSGASDGSSRGSPTTFVRAWRDLIPRTGSNASATTGYRINLLPGTYGEGQVPTFMENAHGTYRFPVVIRGETLGTVTLTRDLNLFNCRYLYIMDLALRTQGDSLHFELCDFVLLRNVRADGSGAAQETLKVNHCQHFYVENCELSGNYENGLDYVAVQFGHVLNSSIHDAGDWCAYVKGGSAHLRFDGNELFNCGTGGFTAGQGTGFEFMTPPWLFYEAVDVKFTNNRIRDTEGSCFGCNGCSFTIFAFNECTRVGTRSHLVEIVPGARSCDGNATRCAQLRVQGGWGPAAPMSDGPNDGGEFIPCRDVIVANNRIVNPAGVQSAYQHFMVRGAVEPITARTGVPSPVLSDERLSIRGNYIRNGGAGMALGIGEEGDGCTASNPTCNTAQLARDNAINAGEAAEVVPLPDFVPWTGGVMPRMPVGQMSNAMVVRSGERPAGSTAATRTAASTATSTAGMLPGDPQLEEQYC